METSARLWIAVSVVLVCGCQETKYSSACETNPMVVAENYARQEYGASKMYSVPTGIERVWHIEDHGDIWTVEFGKQGMMGGGLHMIVRKSDMKVASAALTQ